MKHFMPAGHHFPLMTECIGHPAHTPDVSENVPENPTSAAISVGMN